MPSTKGERNAMGTRKSFISRSPDVIFPSENAPNSISAGTPSQAPLGELTLLMGLLLMERRGRNGMAREGEGVGEEKGRKRRGHETKLV